MATCAASGQIAETSYLMVHEQIESGGVRAAASEPAARPDALFPMAKRRLIGQEYVCKVQAITGADLTGRVGNC